MFGIMSLTVRRTYRDQPIDKKVGPGTMIHKIHGLSSVQLVRRLYARVARIQQLCHLQVSMIAQKGQSGHSDRE